MKTKIVSLCIVLFLILLSSVYGTSTYTYNSSGFHVFEDWDINGSYNTSMWTHLTNGWEWDGTAMTFYGNDSGIGGMFVTNANFQPTFQDEWDTQTRVKLLGCLNGRYAEPHIGIQETTNKVYQDNNSQQFIYGYFANFNTNNCGASSYSLLSSKGSNLVEYYTVRNPTTSLTTSYKIFEQHKRNNENDSYYLETYIDGALITNITSQFENPIALEHLISNFSDDPMYFIIEGINLGNHVITFDWVNITLWRYESCVPNWVCSGYGACNISDLSPCNETTDLNTCGDPYGGDYSEFSAQSCNYCSASVSQYNQSECLSELIITCYQDTNFGSCCDVTGLPSDCPQATEFDCVNETCGLFDYSANDVSPAFLNTIAKFFISTAGIITIIVIISLGSYLYDLMRKK